MGALSNYIRKGRLAVAAAVIAVGSVAAVAVADTIIVDPIASTNQNAAAIEASVTMSANETKTGRAGLLPNDDATDPLDGCNAKDQTGQRVTLRLTSSQSWVQFSNSTAAGATFGSSTTVEISNCDTGGHGLADGLQNGREFQYRTVNAPANTEAVITAAYVSGGKPGVTAGNFRSGSFKINPQTTQPNTPPSVSVAGPQDGSTYNKGSVPTASCDVTDAEDSGEAATPQLSAITGPYASDGIGSQTATCSYTDGGGLTRSDSNTYSIVDPSAPTISYDAVGDEGDNGWYTSDVTLTWTVSDPQSPNSLGKTGCVDQQITADQGSMSYSCSATSAGGPAGPVTVSIKRDASAPTISAARRSGSAANGAGWNNSAVTVEFTCSDNGPSGLNADGCPADVTKSDEGRNQVASGSVKDNAGNMNSASVSNINIDKTGPSAPLAGTTPASPDYGDWFKDSVTVSYSGSTDPDLADATAGSGVAGYSAAQTFSASGTHGYSGQATDNAGNPSSATVGSVKVDADNPTVTITGCPTGAIYAGSSHSVTVAASDDESGLASDPSGTVALDTSSVGSRTLSRSASDNVGHSGSATCNYSVVYNWTGFFRPVDDLPMLNSVKAGSAVPVKFSLGGNQGLSIFAANHPKSEQIACSSTAPVDGIEQTATAGQSALSYDPIAEQYNYVWKTDKAWAGTCRQLVVKLADNTYHRANFKLQK